MDYTTLMSTHDLASHLEGPGWAIVDCRFALTDSERGRRDYRKAHIPGAVYAHLNEDLSGDVIQGVTGRHPLPAVDTFAATLSRWGITKGIQVVAYDDLGGALAAARLWWMLRWLGHEAVAVLDGGWQRWQQERRPVEMGEESRQPAQFIPLPRLDRIVTTEDMETVRSDPSWRVFDCRTGERFRGKNETIDPVAGHIPGAVSVPYVDNLDRKGSFLSPEKLRTRYLDLLGQTPADRAVVYCGSGVTSAHNVLAMVHAGLSEPRLYVGSWSEWITDGQRPVAQS